jgi:hypothetical protein
MIGTERGRIILLSMIFVQKIFARYPEVPGILFQLERRSKLVFLFPHELI